MPVKKFKDPFQPTPSISSTETFAGASLNNRAPNTLKAPNPKGATKEPPSRLIRNMASSVPVTETSSQPTKKYNKETLKIGWSSLSGRALDWLQEGDRFEQMMAETKLRDLGVFLGIATEKVLLLEGQPTQIISQPQHQAIDRLGVALKDALEKRGLVTLTERTVKIEPTTPKPTS